jgi:hypothetical protein
MLFWISFAGEKDGFLGAVIVEAGSVPEALKEATRRGLNPRGEALVCEIPPDGEIHARGHVNQLMLLPEIERLFGPKCDSRELLEVAGEHAGLVCEGCNTVLRLARLTRFLLSQH